MADSDEQTRDPRSNRVDPKTGQSRSRIKAQEDRKSGLVSAGAMQTDNLETISKDEVTFASGDEMIRPTAMADTGLPATEDDGGTGRPTVTSDGKEQTGGTTSTGLPTAMANEAPSGGQSSGARKVASVLYSKREIEERADPDHLPRGISSKQSSGARSTYAGMSGMADKHQNKNL